MRKDLLILPLLGFLACSRPPSELNQQSSSAQSDDQTICHVDQLLDTKVCPTDLSCIPDANGVEQCTRSGTLPNLAGELALTVCTSLTDISGGSTRVCNPELHNLRVDCPDLDFECVVKFYGVPMGNSETVYRLSDNTVIGYRHRFTGARLAYYFVYDPNGVAFNSDVDKLFSPNRNKIYNLMKSGAVQLDPVGRDLTQWYPNGLPKFRFGFQPNPNASECVGNIALTPGFRSNDSPMCSAPTGILNNANERFIWRFGKPLAEAAVDTLPYVEEPNGYTFSFPNLGETYFGQGLARWSVFFEKGRIDGPLEKSRFHGPNSEDEEEGRGPSINLLGPPIKYSPGQFRVYQERQPGDTIIALVSSTRMQVDPERLSEIFVESSDILGSEIYESALAAGGSLGNLGLVDPVALGKVTREWYYPMLERGMRGPDFLSENPVSIIKPNFAGCPPVEGAGFGADCNYRVARDLAYAEYRTLVFQHAISIGKSILEANTLSLTCLPTRPPRYLVPKSCEGRGGPPPEDFYPPSIRGVTSPLQNNPTVKQQLELYNQRYASWINKTQPWGTPSDRCLSSGGPSLSVITDACRGSSASSDFNPPGPPNFSNSVYLPSLRR